MTTVIDQERVNALMAIWLKIGAHDNFDQGMCVMEASAWLAHEPWSDKPLCVSPVLGTFLRLWNDQLDEITRQKLKPYAARVVGTAGDGHDEWRGWICVDWLARTNLPMWLDLAGLDKHATAVRSLAEIIDGASADAARPILSAAESVTGAAAWAAAESALGLASWEAARSVARSAADLVAGAAAESAAESALGLAAWEAARSTARSAADLAAGPAAGDAAESAARSAAWLAAWLAAWSAVESAARSAAWAAAEPAAESKAWAAAWTALAPSVLALQASAFVLLDRMIEGPQ